MQARKYKNYSVPVLRAVIANLLNGLVGMIILVAPVYAGVDVQAVRVSAGQDGTRLVFDLSAPVEYNTFTLEQPDRVVLDIAQAQLTTTELPTQIGLVQTVRSAAREEGGLRVVIDVMNAVQARVFTVAPSGSYGHRLVVDLNLPDASKVQSTTANITTATVESAVTKSAADWAARARDLVIAIDAGHGGEDPGAIGRQGAREKDVTLNIARKLKEKIDAEPGMRAVLTRSGDYFVALRDRIDYARKQQADMFISVHADSVPNRKVTGSSVYVLSERGASSEAARWLAERENAADMVGGVSLDGKGSVLASVLLDLSQGATMSASMEAANKVLGELDDLGDVHHQRVQQAGFVVLKSPDIPSMLVETAFISNPSEEARLKNPRHQNRLAAAILAGVKRYFYDNPPPGTRVAQLKALRQARNNNDPAALLVQN